MEVWSGWARLFGRAKPEYTAVPTEEEEAEVVTTADTGNDILSIQKAVVELTQREQDKVAKAQLYYTSFIQHSRKRMKDMAMQDYQYFRKLQADASELHKIIIQLDTMFEALNTQETSIVAIRALTQGNKLLSKLLKETKAMDVEGTKETLEDLLEEARDETSELSRPLSLMGTGMMPILTTEMEKEFAAYEETERKEKMEDDDDVIPVQEVVVRHESPHASVISAESLVEIPL